MPISLDHSTEEYRHLEDQMAKVDPVDVAYELLSLGYNPKVVMKLIPLFALESGYDKSRPENPDWNNRFNSLADNLVNSTYASAAYKYLGEPSIGLGQFNPSKHMARIYQAIKHAQIGEQDLTVKLPNGEKFFINDEMANSKYYNYNPFKSPEYHNTTPAIIASLRQGIQKMPLRNQILLFDQMLRDQIEAENGDVNTALRNLYYHSMNKIDNYNSYQIGDDNYVGFEKGATREGYEKTGQYLHAKEAYELIDNDPYGVMQKAINKIKVYGPSDIERNHNKLKRDSYKKYTQLESGQNNADFFKYLTYWSDL